MQKTYLSYGLRPHIWATLFTKNATFKVQQKRILKLIQNERHKHSSHCNHGINAGKPIEQIANNGINQRR